jgi:hypothetical protein
MTLDICVACTNDDHFFLSTYTTIYGDRKEKSRALVHSWLEAKHFVF